MWTKIHNFIQTHTQCFMTLLPSAFPHAKAPLDFWEGGANCQAPWWSILFWFRVLLKTWRSIRTSQHSDHGFPKSPFISRKIKRKEKQRIKKEKKNEHVTTFKKKEGKNQGPEKMIFNCHYSFYSFVLFQSQSCID